MGKTEPGSHCRHPHEVCVLGGGREQMNDIINVDGRQKNEVVGISPKELPIGFPCPSSVVLPTVA